MNLFCFLLTLKTPISNIGCVIRCKNAQQAKAHCEVLKFKLTDDQGKKYFVLLLLSRLLLLLVVATKAEDCVIMCSCITTREGKDIKVVDVSIQNKDCFLNLLALAL